MAKEARWVGIEIGGTKGQVAVADAALDPVDLKRFQVDREAGARGILRQVEALLAEIAEEGSLCGVGVGFGGPVDSGRGRVIVSHQIRGWEDFDLGGWIAARTGTTVCVENDANTAALAEAVEGAGRERDPVFYVTLGSGVGGGLVTGGRIYHGYPPGECEVGHLRLDREGTTVESRCSGWAVDLAVRQASARCPETRLGYEAARWPGAEAKALPAAWRSNDPEAKAILERACDDLALGLSHVVHLFHPEAIVIGGGLSLLGEILREQVERRLPEYLMEAMGLGPRIALAQMKEQVVPRGALLLARSKSEERRA